MDCAATIFALSTPKGRSAVAVIRVSGPAAKNVLVRLAGSLPEPRRATLRRLRDPRSGEILDRALVLYFEGPMSETGEDMAELQLHGGRAVIASVLAALAREAGCRMAEPGEFMRRAFDNGKLDLTAAEGLADLIEAETEGQRRQALRQAGGTLAGLYEGWRSQLIEVAALVEAAIDFSDEADVSSRALDMARASAEALSRQVDSHLADGHRGEILREGFRVVLAGPPNVGKSSLMNALARRDVAIVSEEPGTTRDVIEARLDLGGVPVVLTDTAGIREAAGEVEREGIRRTLARAREADLVLWLMDARGGEFGDDKFCDGMSARRNEDRSSCPPFPSPAVPVWTKIDLWEPPQTGAIAVSVRTGEGLPELTSRIAALAAECVGTGEAPVITQARHRRMVEECSAALADFLSGDPLAIELRAEDLRRAAHALGRITGRVDVEDVLDQVFRRFCIGK
jgi:tRNA modification GTPase